MSKDLRRVVANFLYLKENHLNQYKDVVIFFGDAWAQHLAASLQHLDPSNVCGTQMNNPTQQNMENIPARGKDKNPAKPKNVSRRGVGFTKEEDNIICSAFLNVSKDPITGVYQSTSGYYKRMHDYFNEHKPEGCHRSQIAIQHRWASIQKAVSKFCGVKSSML